MKRKSALIVTFIIITFSFSAYFYLSNSYKKIDIFTAKGFNKETNTPIISITDKWTLIEISTIFKTSFKLSGNLNVVEPKYVLELNKLNNHTEIMYLWIDKSSTKGMYMYKSKTETGYSISEKNTLKLKKLLAKTKN
ncbi:hypothetical protein LGL55_24100 [Clostridium tagluense]|uniref:hypothetical protein n=1 Tax=Clostridium tagluense TaxID=360422 RepID=UPI001CF0DA76|nr:hypothetical protein [Clostridium tagluense]MCB2314130.1 hypothetical protein [Clostridium tagluense]MCB2318972.1 hypothetical protein [Clostridium tagluense]MCB2323862.1 hypothetical protein [Clostridium tagluense]MCB2328681.1 hypothetical protein [Clostridium tagluense]MCB2333565.1 hypothetical protein [Clostridium tagluense]